jgi:CRP-like cAMP-binding protein
MDNLLLALLPDEEMALLAPHLQQVSLTLGHPVIVPDKPIEDVYFPTGALLSMVTVLHDGSTIESGTIGREGMSGIPVLLDATQTTMETVAQVAGSALKIKASVLKESYDRAGALHLLLNRYIHTVVVVGSQSAACNARHTLQERFARWLLMSSDGVGSDEVGLTQEYLSVMLGVRRSGVSEVASKLQQAGIIFYQRGNIKILDRPGLEAVACECYQKVRSEYRRLLGTNINIRQSHSR